MDERNGSSSMLSIDSEEFTRLQTQLIDLRTTNYQLKEDKGKSDREIRQLHDTHQNTQKELDKAVKTIQRSKKSKEYQLLVEERDSLVNRLHTQEEDFKLQNKTLLDEIANVCEENGELKKKLKNSVNGGVAEGVVGSNTPELLRLKAENVALQKSLQANRERSNPDGDTIDTAAPSEEVESLRLSLATLEEENNLLQQQMTSQNEKENDFVIEIDKMKKEINKQTEKLKKKQESVVQLQEEKERLILEHKKSHDQLVYDNDQIIERLKSQVATYEQQTGKIHQATKLTEELNDQIAILGKEKQELHTNYSNQSITLTVITQERDDAKHVLNELSLELETTKRQFEEERNITKRLQGEVAEARQASDDLADKVLSTKEDMIRTNDEIKSMAKLAESRKSLLDNMAIKEHKIASEQKRKEDELISGYKSQIDDLSYKLEVEKSSNRELSISLSEVSDLKEQVVKYEAKRSSHKEALQKLKDEYEKDRMELEEELNKQKTNLTQEMESINDQLMTSQSENQELTEKLQLLDEELNEKMNSVKIVEKKSSALIKDLKRQLQQFQKREEKLQHQLMELRGTESINLSTHEDYQPDHSRESSFSSVRGGVDVSSSTPNTSIQMPLSDLDAADTRALMDRITQLQHEKWQLEERVNHLETTGSVLADDVLQKSTIIQKYYMDNKADHVHSSGHLTASSQAKMSPMRLVAWANKTQSKDDNTMAEVNRKMQRALEEALMKNIHLQKDVDMLSVEFHKHNPSDETPPPN